MPQNHFFPRIIISPPPPPPCPLLISSPPSNHQRRRPNMAAATAPFSVICRPTAAAAASSVRCRICRCSIEDKAKSSRQWIGLKEARKKGARVAWAESAVDDAGAAATGAVSESGKGEEGSGGLDERRGRLSRRQRGSSSGGGGNGSVLGGNADLLTVPGVGPRNLRKLVDNGITALAELKQLYKDKFLGESSNKMVEFLRSSVGIIHRNHAQSITTFIKESVDDELKEDGSSSGVKPQKKRLTFCVEGNISVGKTTFLQRIANGTLELRDLVEVVPEPVDKWQDIGPNHSNILDKFYAEPERYAYTFQNYVFVTRVMQERESSSGVKALRLMERSVFSDRMLQLFSISSPTNPRVRPDPYLIITSLSPPPIMGNPQLPHISIP
ncbi:Thymidine kinase 2, mitochondrial-like protein [Drosera capensis]